MWKALTKFRKSIDWTHPGTGGFLFALVHMVAVALLLILVVVSLMKKWITGL
jgi:hypothetical protein